MKTKTPFKPASTLFFALVIILASCGGGAGSGKSAKKLPKNDVLGDMPSIIYQKSVKDSIARAKYKAEMDKITDFTEKSLKKAGELHAKEKMERATIDAEFQAAVEKEKVNLMGKAVPFEVEDGIGYEVTGFVIKDVQKSGWIETEFQVKITDIKAARTTGFGNPELIVTTQDFDAEGNQIGSNSGFYIKLSGKENGASGAEKSYIYIRAKNAAQYTTFAKVKFIKI